MSQPKVTICMPVFNGGEYFRSALNSALAQDYPNLEILIVNDGSTDGGETEQIALAHKDDRIRYFCQENRGVAGALNTAIEQMSGDFFAWLSHDDLHLPHKTASQIDYLRRLGRPHACLFSDYDLIDPIGEFITAVRLPKERIRENPRLPLLNGMINGCTLLMPVGILREFGPFDEALRCVQDYDLWNRILAKHEFFHQPEILVRYRIHPDQGTNTSRAVTEGDVLWKAMLDSRTEIERAQMFGSTNRYFLKLGQFLDATPYQEAAAYAHSRAVAPYADVLVSVVLPFHNEVMLALRAVRSALQQTHSNIEIVVVDDGSLDSIAPLEEVVRNESRVRLLRQANAGPAAARNLALHVVRGDYVVFLDADDQFLPHKIERQLAEMQRHGALFSHTSYYVNYPGAQECLGIWRSAAHDVGYPQIIGMCPIAMPTVMLHRSLVDEGFLFPVAFRVGEDVVAWIDLAMRYMVLEIDEPLSIVEWSDTSAALNAAKHVSALSALVDLLDRHPIHGRHKDQIAKLRRALLSMGQEWIAAHRDIGAIKLSSNLIEAAYPIREVFLAAGNGRTPQIRGGAV